jgi:hypothetical protein
MTEHFTAKGIDSPRVVARCCYYVLDCERMWLYMEMDPGFAVELIQLRELVTPPSMSLFNTGGSRVLFRPRVLWSIAPPFPAVHRNAGTGAAMASGESWLRADRRHRRGARCIGVRWRADSMRWLPPTIPGRWNWQGQPEAQVADPWSFARAGVTHRPGSSGDRRQFPASRTTPFAPIRRIPDVEGRRNRSQREGL